MEPTAKKQRTLPNADSEPESPAEMTLQTVVEQYLLECPERFGKLLTSLPKDKAAQALRSVPRKELDKLRDKLHGENGYQIKETDRIAVLLYDKANLAKTTYTVVPFSSIPAHVARLIQQWYTPWLRSINTLNSNRLYSAARDSSAEIDLDRKFENLEEEIDFLCEPFDDDDDDDEYDKSDKDTMREALVSDLLEFFKGRAFARFDDIPGPSRGKPARTTMWLGTPLITIRMDMSEI